MWLVTTGLTFLVVILDERRMAKKDDVRLEDAWPPTSRDAAIISLGPLALPFHFARTRGRFFDPRRFHLWLLGFGMGIVALLLVLVASSLFEWLISAVLGLPME